MDGATSLLCETASHLNRLDAEYAVIGGWSPFLLNSKPFQHPGTRDVDVLFSGGVEPSSLSSIIQDFLAKGFKPSAKHPFQLIRIIMVAGVEFVFNVDLLHPAEAEKNPEMFVDQISLPVPISEYRDDSFVMKSIILPSSGFVFEGHVLTHSVREPIDGTLVDVRLIDELATIVTKSHSLGIQKRSRDALDVFLAINQARDYRALVAGFIELKRTHLQVYNTLYALRAASENGSFAMRVAEQMAATSSEQFSAGYHTTTVVEKFLDDVELEPLAHNPA
jgi:hypothetical protein